MPDLTHRPPVPNRSIGGRGLEAIKRIGSGRPVSWSGRGSPGNAQHGGVVLSAPVFGWHDLDLRSMLQEAFDCPVVLGNDANVAAFAGYTYGGGAEDMTLIRIGVGVSMAILLDGKPILGSRSAVAGGHALGATPAPIVATVNKSEIVLSGHTQIVEGLFSSTVIR